MLNNTNPNESAPAWGERNFESCKIEVLQDGTYQVVNFTKTKVFFTGTYEACYTWILENHQGFSRSVLTKPAAKTSDVTMRKETSIEWYIEQRNLLENDIRSSLFGLGAYFKRKSEIEIKARAMHKEEVVNFTDSYVKTQCDGDYDGDVVREIQVDEYYNETYGGNNE